LKKVCHAVESLPGYNRCVAIIVAVTQGLRSSREHMNLTQLICNAYDKVSVVMMFRGVSAWRFDACDRAVEPKIIHKAYCGPIVDVECKAAATLVVPCIPPWRLSYLTLRTAHACGSVGT
jgi:hypothetical protein